LGIPSKILNAFLIANMRPTRLTHLILLDLTALLIFGREYKRMRWAGHVVRMGEVFTGFRLRVPKVRELLEDLGVGGRITLRWILGRQESMGRTGFGWLRIGSSGGLL
jgi:hypothetical protein